MRQPLLSQHNHRCIRTLQQARADLNLPQVLKETLWAHEQMAYIRFTEQHVLFDASTSTSAL